MSGPRLRRHTFGRARRVLGFWTEADAETNAVERGDCLVIVHPSRRFVCSVPAEIPDAHLLELVARAFPPADPPTIGQTAALLTAIPSAAL